MSYVNTGAYVHNRRPASKKALREAIAAGVPVWFDGTDAFTPGNYAPDDIPVGVKLSVVGPDPYTKRSWYATVTRDASGKVKVA